MVFQDYALYPHMTVADNMAFSLLYRGVAKAEIKARVAEAARVLDLVTLLERYPRQLSGGQRQRVAMGRAIVRDPKVFLFDEPLSNLDAKLRVQMRTEIKRLRERLETTTIYVTHDQVEAMTLADRIVVLDAGRIEQVGTPEDVYDRPATTFVAGFIGAPPMNLVPGRIVRAHDGPAVELPAGVILPLAQTLGVAPGGRRSPASGPSISNGRRRATPPRSRFRRRSWSRSAPTRSSASASASTICRCACRRGRCAAPASWCVSTWRPSTCTCSTGEGRRIAG